MSNIQVCKGKTGHFLRLYLGDQRIGTIRFATMEEFSKPEADLRAMFLSSKFGFDRDELPTYSETDPT